MSEPNARPENPETNSLEQERKALLQEALARPGVREVMRLYGVWQERDEWMNPYRAATKKRFYKITFSDRTGIR